MTKKLCLLSFLLVFVFTNVDAQVTIFAEDFESAAGPENIASPYINWQNGQFTTTPPTNNNYFWVFDNTRCNVISGNYSMAVSINPPVTSGTLPEYRTTRVASTFVYHTTPIDATNFTNLTLDFNWICEGETGFDYGSVLYSLDATNWSTLPGVYQGQNTVQNVTNLDLSVLDGQIFYLAFGWNNDSSLGSFPGFIVDDIDVKGTPLSACTTPNQPTGLNLTPTNNTIIGSFNNAAPIPDNYLVLISTNATPPTPIDGTTYNIGDTIGTGTVVDIDSDTSFTATGLNANTTYYVFVYSYNSLCSGGPTYNVVSPLSGNETTTNSIYCTPLTQNSPGTLYIDDVQFLGTLNDINNISNGFSSAPSGYQDFTTSIANSIQAQGQGINIYVGSNTARGRYKAWVDWDKDGLFDNTTELVYDSGGVLTATTTFGFIIPTNQPIGDYRIRIRFNNAYNNRWGNEEGSYDYTACENFIFHNFSGQNNDYTDYGEAEDYLFTVVQSCTAQITSISEGSTCGPGSATLSVTGNASATDFYWYANETGGSPIATSATFSPNISATTTYWVTATDGSCESLKRIAVTATLNPITELTITPATPIICGSNDVIEIAASGSTEVAYLIDEDFESGGTGVFNVINFINNSPAEDAMTQWQNRTSTFVPNQQVWYPAISSGFGTNQFVMATSDINPSSGYVWTYLESPVLDSSNFTDLTLSFDMYFSKYSATSNPDNVLVYVSTDGGTNYNLIQDIDYDVGIGTNFDNINIDLSAYINEPNLRITIDYYAGWMDGVAIDNVQLYGNRPLNPSFTWTGTVDAYTDAAATIPYTPGSPAASVFVKPTLAQLNMSNFTFTANATLSNGCTINKDITITNNSKIWNGSVNSDWDTAANWSPNGVPTSNNCINIRNTGTNPIIAGTTTGNGLNLTIENGATLTQQSNSTLTIVNFIDVETGGTYDMEDSSSLIQVDNIANNVDGTFTMDRNSADIRLYNYVYWSSPVTNFDIETISPLTPTNYLYYWNPSYDRGASPPPNNVPNDYGRWETAGGTMNVGTGYIVRGPTGYSTSTPNPFTATFFGTPNNGDILNVPISRGTFDGLPYNGLGDTQVTEDDDNWNLLGNPYPSAISGKQFVIDNTNIDGTLYLWTHATELANNPTNDPFYDNFVYNYDDDYISVNLSGPLNPGDPGDLMIGAGQGFFVFMNDDPIITNNVNSTVFFNNAMRNATYANNVFYRNSSNSTSEDEIERHRIWLDIVSPNNIASTILVGYIQGATNEDDRLYDGYAFSGSETLMYSIVDDKKMAIQGKSLPFNEQDTVPLGVIFNSQGSYSIAINTLDGLFETTDQNIYLEDTYLGIIHDLRSSPYSFSSETGTFNDRFVLKYINSTLGVQDFDSLNGVKVYKDNDEIVVTSSQEVIETIKVYDILGRNLFTDKSINLNRFSINSIVPNELTLFLKIKLADGKQKIAKIIF